MSGPDRARRRHGANLCEQVPRHGRLHSEPRSPEGHQGILEQRDYVVKGSWANVGQNASYAVADACAEALNKL
jgi:hypothetical protein